MHDATNANDTMKLTNRREKRGKKIEKKQKNTENDYHSFDFRVVQIALQTLETDHNRRKIVDSPSNSSKILIIHS